MTAAIEGAKSGLSITLYEKYKIGENIRCAEGFFDTLNLLGEPNYGVKFKIDEIVVRLNSHFPFPTDNKINIWMIDRAEWQRGLADEARALGVNIVENSPVDKARFGEIVTRNKWVIDSTGVSSITSLVHGFNRYYTDTSAISTQYMLEGNFEDLYGKLKLGVEKHYLGYYWIFPKSLTEANIGIGFLKKNNLNLWHELDRILEKEGISSYRKVKKLGGLCPTMKLDRLTYDNVLLTGDAAGLTSPLHGGGIDTACISGKIAMQSIVNNSVDSYESELNNILGQKLQGENELLEGWHNLTYPELEDMITIIHAANIGLGKLGLLNGKFELLKKIEYLKSTPFLGKYLFNLKLVRSLPPMVVRWLFPYLAFRLN